MVDRILELIASMDLTREIDILQKNRALGNAKHKSMVIEKFKSITTLLAESLFCWAAQTPLRREECKRLILHLSKVQLSETKDGSLDKINLILLFALLYSIDSSYLLVIEDLTEGLGQFPITNDPQFIPEIHKEIKEGNWECPGMLGVVQLAWSVSLTILRQIPIDSQILEKEGFIEDDEVVLDKALKEKPFNFIEKALLAESNLPLDTFHAQKLHSILTDFIHHLSDRVRIMKNIADENARKIAANVREGLEPPTNLEQPYEDLLNCLAALYTNSQCEDLVEDYWYDHLYTSTPFRNQSLKQIALYRFVRLPGDFLPPSLFVPYLNFLCGIATSAKAAQSAYNFLRMNNQPLARGSNLSWDNFLNAFTQYYNNMRGQHPQSMYETIYQTSSRSSLRCISPQELKGLTAVLRLIQVISLHDESSRIALCSNSAWSPIHVFVGLLTCGVPISLKTCLLKTLAAFSASPNLGGKVWQAIESAGIVPAYDGVPGYTSRGLRQDIEEIESRCEEFPLSQAFLELLLALAKAGVPQQASSGSASVPGFKPSFELFKNQIFLPHDSRTYKNGAERWALARKSMELFLQLLRDYQPPPQNLPPTEMWNNPSHMLLLELIQDSLLLRQTLSVLHDAVQALELYVPISGRKDLEHTLLCLLEVLLLVSKLQRHALNREVKGDMLLIGIDRLLLTMNVRSGACDHLLNVALLLGHHVTLPRVAALTCRVLGLVGSSPSGQTHMLPLLTTPASRGVLFRQNFVQLLDHAGLDEEHTRASEAALGLLKACLRLPGPNVAHFLLGFVDGNGIGSAELRSDLLEPGVRGFPRTALHAVLAALPALPEDLSAAAHDLLFLLTSTPATSAATLRYLSSHDFVHHSLSSLPAAVAAGEGPARLLAAGWVLRVAALDLRYHASHRQRSQLRRLIGLLVTGADPDPDPDAHAEPPLDVSLVWNGGPSPPEARGILLSLLEAAELTVDAPPALHCQFLTRAPEMMRLCEEAAAGGARLVNVPLLHQMLCRLLREAGSAAPHDPLDAEVQDALDHALALNQARRSLAAQRHFLEAWRQLVEVVVAVSPSELADQPPHRSFLHTLALELTRRLLDDAAHSELSSILVSTLLLLVTTLRTLYAAAARGPRDAAPLPSSLQLVLRGTLDCVLRFKQAAQSVRASLYAALLNYLEIRADFSPSSASAAASASMLAAPKETAEEQFHRENYEALRDDLPQLVHVLSHEASAGHVVCRLLALSCLDALAALDRRAGTPLSSDSPVLAYLAAQGHLRVLLDGVQSDDHNLIKLITEGDRDLRPLYLWEVRASLLTRLALNPVNARLLLQAGLLTKLSEMEVFKYHPADSDLLEAEGEDVYLSLVYGGAVTGAVRICMAVLTALGPRDDSAVSQVLLFLSSNADAVVEAMRVPTKASLGEALRQLALLTSVVASASPPALYSDQKDVAALETAAQTQRLRRHLLMLLPHFKPDSRLGEVVEELPQISEDGACVREASRTALLRVFANCLAHARDNLLHDDALYTDATLLFQPTTEPLDASFRGARRLSLGTLLSALDQASREFLKARAKREETLKTLKEIETAHFDSLRQFVSPSLVASASPSAVRKLAAIYLDSLVEQHTQQEELSVHAVEACMFLLYRHLQYYLKTDQIAGGKKPSLRDSEVSLPFNLTADQAAELKAKVRVPVEEMLPRITQVEKLYSSSAGHVPFLEGCITRVRWLIAS